MVCPYTGCKKVAERRPGDIVLDNCEKMLSVWHCNKQKVEEMANKEKKIFRDVIDRTKCYEIKNVTILFSSDCNHFHSSVRVATPDVIETKINEKGCYELYQNLAFRNLSPRVSLFISGYGTSFCFRSYEQACMVPVDCAKEDDCFYDF